jgi:hypothetical protein
VVIAFFFGKNKIKPEERANEKELLNKNIYQYIVLRTIFLIVDTHVLGGVQIKYLPVIYGCAWLVDKLLINCG